MSSVDAGGYLIIGSGIAGSTVARRLLEHDPDTPITIVEAGDRIPNRRRRAWWDYVVSGALPYDYTYPESGMNTSSGNVEWEYERTRMIAYGGTTVHWGGWAPRMKPEDFFLFTNTGDGADWPFDYDTLEPYYAQAEVLLGVCGDADEGWTPRSGPFPLPPYEFLPQDLEMKAGFEAVGLRGGHMPLARFRRCMTTGTCRYCPVGARFNGADALDGIVEELRPGALQVRCRTVATRLLLEGAGRVAGVEAIDTRDGTTLELHADTVIVANGAYEVPKLLMASTGDGWPHGIGNACDHLGRYIVTHSFLAVSGDVEPNPNRWIEEYDFPTLMSRSLDTSEQQRDGKVFLVRDAQAPNTPIAQLMQQGRTAEQIHRLVQASRQVSLSGFYEEKGQPGNRLTLLPGTDRFGLPRMDISFSRTPETVASGWHRIAQMSEVLTAMGYRVTQQSFEAPAGFHVAGTARIADHPDRGVADADLRVFDVDNLYLCSNAVFPSIGAVNPTLTLAALSLRLGDHLIEFGR